MDEKQFEISLFEKGKLLDLCVSVGDRPFYYNGVVVSCGTKFLTINDAKLGVISLQISQIITVKELKCP